MLFVIQWPSLVTKQFKSSTFWIINTFKYMECSLGPCDSNDIKYVVFIFINKIHIKVQCAIYLSVTEHPTMDKIENFPPKNKKRRHLKTSKHSMDWQIIFLNTHRSEIIGSKHKNIFCIYIKFKVWILLLIHISLSESVTHSRSLLLLCWYFRAYTSVKYSEHRTQNTFRFFAYEISILCTVSGLLCT